MGKMKIGIYCYLIADILTKVFLKYLVCGPVLNQLAKPTFRPEQSEAPMDTVAPSPVPKI